jgi:UDP-N-acetyl-D-galactosamine dehydrogenase
LVRELQAWGATVVVSDPFANPAEVQHEYGIQMGTIDKANPVDALVVAVGHEQYRRQTPQQLRQLCKGTQPVLGDIKSLFNRHDAAAAGFIVFRF